MNKVQETVTVSTLRIELGAHFLSKSSFFKAIPELKVYVDM